ncbi:hypothetical protein C0W54_07430 [Photobacterium kishitanii]|uniref:hypothetical protein n=1 Tax=Photobacterium kishitanii TaxID=318456 RepID=UPI000D16DD47|nr:hypothetical protein [Photobacterium kishitanii]PSW62154.1 hypothetical protein C0W54_07430 [Photobacterium kishitanii]
MVQEHYLDDIISSINYADDINEAEKNQVLRNLTKLKCVVSTAIDTGRRVIKNVGSSIVRFFGF